MPPERMSQRCLLSILIVLLAWSQVRAAQPVRKSKKAEAAQLAQMDDDLPHPDPLPTPLNPQRPLAPEGGPVHQSLHFRGASNRKGIDVSHYQGKIDWRQVARSGNVTYVYIKATEGASLVDNTYRTNLAGARAAGLKVGIYHFYSPTAAIDQQLRNLTQNVDLRQMDLIPIIDVEHRGKASHADFCSRLRRFLQQVERHYGVQPIIYTGQNFYNKHLSGTFANYRYMIAKYDTEIPYLVDDAPFLMWQYSATGRLAGIRGNVDFSCFMDNYDLNDILLR